MLVLLDGYADLQIALGNPADLMITQNAKAVKCL
jgi:hypothetical protein